jgi:hypothetical protein
MPNGNPAPGPLNSRYFRPVRGKETRARRWDLQFESTSLQRRVDVLHVAYSADAEDKRLAQGPIHNFREDFCNMRPRPHQARAKA